VVDVPRVRIVGEIEAADKLTSATWAVGEPVAGEKRNLLPGEKQTRLAIQHEVTLTEPGKPFKLRFQARTAASDEAERQVVLLYQPRLPEVRLTAPVDGQPFIEGKDTLPIRVEGRLSWPEGRHPITAQLLVNDKEQGQPVAIDVKAETLVTQATLAPGENSIRLRLKNSWAEDVTIPVSVAYRRPPRVVALRGPARSVKPFADVVAEVETAKSLPLTQVKIKGSELAASLLKPEVVEQKADSTLFQIAFRELPLQRGKNRIEFEAGNADGWSLKPALLEIEVDEPVEPRAEVNFLDPQQNLVVEAGQYDVEFQVRSRSVLRRIELERGGERVNQRTDFGDVRRSPDGWYEVRTRQSVPLLPGPNSLKVIAHNAGGEQVSPGVVVTYRAAPVRVRIDTLLVEKTALSPNVVLPDNTLVFQTASDRVRLQGRVEWAAQNPDRSPPQPDEGEPDRRPPAGFGTGTGQPDAVSGGLHSSRN
jgi:hypothetical protein